MRKKNTEAEVESVKTEVSNADLISALEVMDKKLNILVNVMLKINDEIDKKNGK